jgi:type III pantothenate kinase
MSDKQKRKTRTVSARGRKLLLALDVGNTNTVLGVFEGKKLIANWRLTTAREQTVDEYGILTRDLFMLAGLAASAIRGVIVASVVPPMNGTLEQMAERYFGLKAIFVEGGTKVSTPVLYSNPKEVGADRIANAAAAFAKYGGPAVVVDFGTAINFDVISTRGEYLGGVIAPGVGISADALFAQAARLFRIEIRDPHRVVGKNTAESMQAGFYYGFVGLVDGILERLKKELGAKTRIVATGGQASLIAAGSRFIETVDEHLTLDGLRILWDKHSEK